MAPLREVDINNKIVRMYRKLTWDTQWASSTAMQEILSRLILSRMTLLLAVMN